MNRILEPINILDIIKMADYLYGENKYKSKRHF